MWVIDGHEGEPQPAVPRGECVAKLSKLTRPPSSVERFDQVLAEGTLRGDDAVCSLAGDAPIRYPVVAGRDVALGRNLMFSTFIRVMDYGERLLLTERVWPRFPAHVADLFRPLERETYYLANCPAGSVILIDLRGEVRPCSGDALEMPKGLVAVGVLTLYFELYREGTNELLAVSRGRKVIAAPSGDKRALADAKRICQAHAT